MGPAPAPPLTAGPPRVCTTRALAGCAPLTLCTARRAPPTRNSTSGRCWPTSARRGSRSRCGALRAALQAALQATSCHSKREGCSALAHKSAVPGRPAPQAEEVQQARAEVKQAQARHEAALAELKDKHHQARHRWTDIVRPILHHPPAGLPARCPPARHACPGAGCVLPPPRAGAAEPAAAGGGAAGEPGNGAARGAGGGGAAPGLHGAVCRQGAPGTGGRQGGGSLAQGTALARACSILLHPAHG